MNPGHTYTLLCRIKRFYNIKGTVVSTIGAKVLPTVIVRQGVSPGNAIPEKPYHSHLLHLLAEIQWYTLLLCVPTDGSHNIHHLLPFRKQAPNHYLHYGIGREMYILLPSHFACDIICCIRRLITWKVRANPHRFTLRTKESGGSVRKHKSCDFLLNHAT